MCGGGLLPPARTLRWLLLGLLGCGSPTGDRGPRGSDGSDPDSPFSTTGLTTRPTTTSTQTTPDPAGCFTVKTLGGGYGTGAVAQIPMPAAEPLNVLPLVGAAYGVDQILDLAWMDGTWFACDGSSLWIIDGVTGQVERQIGCYTLAEVDGRLWVQPSQWSAIGFEVYDYALDVSVQSPTETIPNVFQANYSRTGGGVGVLYAVWHAADLVDVYDPVTGTTSVIPLEGFDDWTYGLEEEGGVLRVLDGDAVIHRFDAITGNAQQQQELGNGNGYDLRGLWCSPGAP